MWGGGEEERGGAAQTEKRDGAAVGAAREQGASHRHGGAARSRSGAVPVERSGSRFKLGPSRRRGASAGRGRAEHDSEQGGVMRRGGAGSKIT